MINFVGPGKEASILESLLRKFVADKKTVEGFGSKQEKVADWLKISK